jgi:hypothetical protein
MFLGERVFTTINAARMTLSVAGFGLAVAYFVLRLAGAMNQSGERRSIERLLAVFAFFSVLALALAFGTTEAGEKLIGIAKAPTETKDKFETIGTIAWLRCRRSGHAHSLRRTGAPSDATRREAGGATRAGGRGRGLRSPWRRPTVRFTYAAGELELKADFPRGRRSRANRPEHRQGARGSGQGRDFLPPSTMSVARSPGLKEPAVPPQIHLQVHDRLLELQLARDWKVTQDGVLIVAAPTDETLTIGVDMERAGAETLDTDFQKTSSRSRAKFALPISRRATAK